MCYSLLITKFVQNPAPENDLWNYQPRSDVIAEILGIDSRSCLEFIHGIKQDTTGSNFYFASLLKQFITIPDLIDIVTDYLSIENDTTVAQCYVLHRSQIKDAFPYFCHSFNAQCYEVADNILCHGLSEWCEEENKEEWLKIYFW